MALSIESKSISSYWSTDSMTTFSEKINVDDVLSMLIVVSVTKMFEVILTNEWYFMCTWIQTVLTTVTVEIKIIRSYLLATFSPINILWEAKYLPV